MTQRHSMGCVVRRHRTMAALPGTCCKASCMSQPATNGLHGGSTTAHMYCSCVVTNWPHSTQRQHWHPKSAMRTFDPAGGSRHVQIGASEPPPAPQSPLLTPCVCTAAQDSSTAGDTAVRHFKDAAGGANRSQSPIFTPWANAAAQDSTTAHRTTARHLKQNYANEHNMLHFCMLTSCERTAA
jgi:hypothetical protein